MDQAIAKSQSSFTDRDLRDALASFATGVTIVTTTDKSGEPIGMTASSFNSVSMDPPLVLWSVTKSAFSAPVFRDSKHFSIHILATDQTELSNRFARTGTDKFGETEYHIDQNNVPIIAGPAARFDCETWAVHEGGDHWIMIGKVIAIETAKKEGLVFGGGSYATASPLTAVANKIDHAPGAGEIVEDMLFYHLSRAYHQMSRRFHEAVRDAGMTVAEWRIAASLYGKATRSYSDLCSRTFLDMASLNDVVMNMVEDGLCVLHKDSAEKAVTGTQKGHEKVAHLFDLAKEHEKVAFAKVGDEAQSTLKNSLKQIVTNTQSID